MSARVKFKLPIGLFEDIKVLAVTEWYDKKGLTFFIKEGPL